MNLAPTTAISEHVRNQNAFSLGNRRIGLTGASTCNQIYQRRAGEGWGESSCWMVSFRATHILWRDEIHFAPPQTPWIDSIPQREYQETLWFHPWCHFVVRNEFRNHPQYLNNNSPVHTNKQWFPMLLRWRDSWISSIPSLMGCKFRGKKKKQKSPRLRQLQQLPEQPFPAPAPSSRWRSHHSWVQGHIPPGLCMFSFFCSKTFCGFNRIPLIAQKVKV